MGWHSSIVKINNKNSSPDKRWDVIYDSIMEIFNTNSLPEGLTSKEIEELLKNSIYDIANQKTKFSNIDNQNGAKQLTKLLKPGKTSTLYIDKHKIELLNKQYGGTKDGYFIKIELNYLDESNKHPTIRLFSEEDYEAILEIIASFNTDNAYKILIQQILEKIELASFCKGGDRKARWDLDQIHSEYGNYEECHKVAAKLVYFLIDIIEFDLTKKNLLKNKTMQIENAKKACASLFTNNELNFINKVLPKGVCPMCLEKIYIVDFFRNGRNDEKSLVFGHYEYRADRNNNAHSGKNAFWLHRTCNMIQGEDTIAERLPKLQKIAQKHNNAKINWDNRG
jgi:hypothetical protein